ncbi:hypothetical protein NQ318_002464 [Aromia moschata]|uniref:Protein kinase domain-containing protein n=1 Tax=Aromia moschata TaxID=1265417 RepID=A0AAV8Y833_9CUCU|nr:hypothetical protein NQ318_002464 [Aromia moschata]
MDDTQLKKIEEKIGGDLSDDDFEKLGELGSGNGGVWLDNGTEINSLEVKPAIKKQIIRVESVTRVCLCPHSWLHTREYIREDYIGCFKGFKLLKDKHAIMHRDVKLSNILVNSSGEIKICDFGVSGQLIDSMANSLRNKKLYVAGETTRHALFSAKRHMVFGFIAGGDGHRMYPIPPPDAKTLALIFGPRNDNDSDHTKGPPRWPSLNFWITS